jgi:hypothetical protein
MVGVVEMSPPRILEPDDGGEKVIIMVFPAGIDYTERKQGQLVSKYGVEVVVSSMPEIDAMRLLLAKVGHSIATAWFGDGFFPFLPDLIRAKDANSLKMFVGKGRGSADKEQLHDLELRYVRRGRQKLIVFTITLFGSFDFPSYDVVVGRSYKNFPEIPKTENVFYSEKPDISFIRPKR